jgi:hypothetical protein
MEEVEAVADAVVGVLVYVHERRQVSDQVDGVGADAIADADFVFALVVENRRFRIRTIQHGSLGGGELVGRIVGVVVMMMMKKKKER